MSNLSGSKKQIGLTLGCTAAVLLAFALSSFATPPPPPPPPGATQLTFQARITSPTGQPISGAFDMSFRIVDAPTGGAVYWEELHGAGTLPAGQTGQLPQVQVAGGVLSSALGEGVPLTPAVFDPSAAADRYVVMLMGGNEVGRVKLTATAFAVTATTSMGVWDATTSTSLDVSALDARYGAGTGTGTGTGVQTINGAAPDASGAFTVAPGPSGNVTVTATANGLQIDSSAAAGGVQTINGAAPDAAGAFSIAGGANVTVTPGANGVQIASTGLDQATADGRYVRSSSPASGGYPEGTLLVASGGSLVELAPPAAAPPGSPEQVLTFDRATLQPTWKTPATASVMRSKLFNIVDNRLTTATGTGGTTPTGTGGTTPTVAIVSNTITLTVSGFEPKVVLVGGVSDATDGHLGAADEGSTQGAVLFSTLDVSAEAATVGRARVVSVNPKTGSTTDWEIKISQPNPLTNLNGGGTFSGWVLAIGE